MWVILQVHGQKKMLPSLCIGTRANMRFVVPPKFRTHCVPFGLLGYGEGAVGIYAPAHPLSFVQSGRVALSAASLSVGR